MGRLGPRALAGRVSLLFGVGTVAALALVVVLWRHGSAQAAGIALALTLAALAAGLGVWANRLTPPGPFREDRPTHMYPADVEEAGDDLAEGAQLPRRRLVVGTLVAACGTLGVALFVPFSSLGPRPGTALLRTAWRAGRRAVDGDGHPIRADEIRVGGLATIFPEHHVDDADAPVVLVRVRPRDLRLPADREGWAPDGLVAYSKVCTHAGCSVGLYDADAHRLLCPCHQSAFDVLRGATPTSGPAAWPLPQLPLRVAGDGTVEATGPLSGPVGPGWWREGGR
jgi:ubiquinol-cytochrome c reductase iron-sulfur subunit